MKHQTSDSLVAALLETYDRGYGIGSMTATIYDTAWVSCISKPSGGSVLRQWLFPSALQFLLDSQASDGGWHWPPRGRECFEGTLLSSLAALFAITQHIKHPYQLTHLQSALNSRLQRGIDFLTGSLDRLPGALPNHVGFEVLVPALLDLLKQEGIQFDFPSRQRLERWKEAKLSKIPIRNVQQMPSTLLHSVEALYAERDFDFDSLRDRLVGGSVMASPAATAAYLMRANEWDESAEAYLRLVLSSGTGSHWGAVPSASPSTNFELIWVASTLLQAHCLSKSFLEEHGDHMLRVFGTNVPEDDLAGFAPGIEPDVDDSARASIVLSLLGRPGFSHQMRLKFEAETHFETYKKEANGSVGANCNVLLALLLDIEHDAGSVSAITKVVKYLSSFWFQAEGGKVEDKWNISEYYPQMLLSQAFVKLLRCWEGNELPSLDEETIRTDVVLTAFRVLLRLLMTQHDDGSWGVEGPREETAYALLALVDLACLSVAIHFDQQIQYSIDRGRKYLQKAFETTASPPPEYLWVEKVRYGSQNLSQAYIQAALHSPVATPMATPRIQGLVQVDAKEMNQFTRWLRMVPMLSDEPQWLLSASWLEGQLFLPMLQHVRKAVFTRMAMTKDKYFAWIPILWTLANNVASGGISARLMFEMMKVSILNFQVDEFMESEVDADAEQEVQALIDDIFRVEAGSPLRSSEEVPAPAVATGSTTNGENVHTNGFSKRRHDDTDSSPAKRPRHSPIAASLHAFESHFTTLGLPAYSLTLVFTEIRRFLRAHLTQNALNRAFAQGATASHMHERYVHSSDASARRLPVPDLRTYLHDTAALHTSAPYSFALYVALADAARATPLLHTSRQQYVAADICGHLSRLCRLYNDVGSMSRDAAEGNVNCVTFAAAAEGGDAETLKQRVLGLAEWERAGLERGMAELEGMEETDASAMKTLGVFVRVTDLFGQVYLLRDLASRKKAGT